MCFSLPGLTLRPRPHRWPPPESPRTSLSRTIVFGAPGKSPENLNSVLNILCLWKCGKVACFKNTCFHAGLSISDLRRKSPKHRVGMRTPPTLQIVEGRIVLINQVFLDLFDSNKLLFLPYLFKRYTFVKDRNREERPFVGKIWRWRCFIIVLTKHPEFPKCYLFLDVPCSKSQLYGHGEMGICRTYVQKRCAYTAHKKRIFLQQKKSHFVFLHHTCCP